MEQNIVSVERILHQTKVKSEAPHERHDSLAPHDWPSAGKIVFECVLVLMSQRQAFSRVLTYSRSHYSTKYRPELDLVLKDIDITIVSRQFVFYIRNFV